jgi:hypothetical protein
MAATMLTGWGDSLWFEPTLDLWPMVSLVYPSVYPRLDELLRASVGAGCGRVFDSAPGHHYFCINSLSDTPHLLRRRSLVLPRYAIALRIIDPLLQVLCSPRGSFWSQSDLPWERAFRDASINRRSANGANPNNVK